MATATITKSVTIDGHGGTMNRTGTSYSVATRLAGSGTTLGTGFAGTLTTRTDNDTGVVTTTSSPTGIITNDIVDVYWSGGQRRGMTATVSGSAITIDGGTGTNLPSASTAISCIVEVTEVTFTTVTMANVKALVAKVAGTTQRCQVSFILSSAEVDSLLLNNPTTTGHVFGDTFCWDDLFSETNELAGVTTFTSVRISCDEVTNAATFTLDIAT